MYIKLVRVTTVLHASVVSVIVLSSSAWAFLGRVQVHALFLPHTKKIRGLRIIRETVCYWRLHLCICYTGRKTAGFTFKWFILSYLSANLVILACTFECNTLLHFLASSNKEKKFVATFLEHLENIQQFHL